MNVKLRKTEAGLQALQSRDASARLPARLRTLLLQIDGRKRTPELARLALALGSQADTVEKLLELGLVEIVPGSKIAELTPAATPATTVAEPGATQRGITAAALAQVATSPLPHAQHSLLNADTDADADQPNTELASPVMSVEPAVSTKLPQLLHPVALLMHKIADHHLSARAAMLKRRISKSETESELRLSLMALREALAKINDLHHADEALHVVYAYLPITESNPLQAS
ncbi:hypothetical protein [Chitinimonas sp. BJB300]|uniref:hypothetical protein n=1 Tax=Chitinimonas sp. BJB300 TaxID=1559339 RepID=UPI000C117ED9|nr:hypothetical protein [Chitinimonas sp. BJB300]PHV13305.1 hypothetical protein CSQ89_01305 [Chitinimonas sp. BJB300]TSJ85990.1 hypothetical protein FG002_016615 [Chitinimonas sp. BJB300]